ncbi:MAG: sulfite exporter TauE/SafE family protein [Terracidiphilus sp.]
MSNLSALWTTINWHWVWLVTAAFLAGVLNAVAGGGSFLSFPALLGMKMLPVQANATNTVAIWPGQLTSVAAYWPDVRGNLRAAWLMGLAGLLGGMAGAIVLLNTPQKTFMRLVPWLLLFAACTFAVSGPVTRALERLKLDRLKRKRNASAGSGGVHAPRRMLLFLATAVVSFYVGYFGAGAGFLFMTLLALFGYEDIHAINALKVVANLLANGIAFVIFIIDGQVVWRFCLAAMVAAAIGGYTSASLARRVPQPVLRGLVVAIGLSMAAWFFVKQ